MSIEVTAIIWVLCGVAGHVLTCVEMKRWHATVWEEFNTYLMLVPAMIAGPIVLTVSVFWLFNKDKKQ